MLTRIVHNSEKLCTFVDQLDLPLSQPRQRHLLNMADFLRISLRSAAAGRAALHKHQVSWLLAEAERTDAPKVIYIRSMPLLG